jgi:hypothetical protein
MRLSPSLHYHTLAEIHEKPLLQRAGRYHQLLRARLLKTIIGDLNKVRYQLRKLVNPATVLDGLELICGNGYNQEKASQVIQAGWGHDPVHPNKHIYAKMALNVMEKMSASKTEAKEVNSRKRTWSATNSESGNSVTSGNTSCSGGGGGGGGMETCSAATRTGPAAATATTAEDTRAAAAEATADIGRSTAAAVRPTVRQPRRTLLSG